MSYVEQDAEQRIQQQQQQAMMLAFEAIDSRSLAVRELIMTQIESQYGPQATIPLVLVEDRVYAQEERREERQIAREVKQTTAPPQEEGVSVGA